MSKSSFYHYLGSKEALFDTVVTEVGAALVDSLDVPRTRANSSATASGAGSRRSWTG